MLGLGLVVIPELLRAYSIYRMLIYGFALVLLAIYRPQGLFRKLAGRYDQEQAEKIRWE